MLGIAKIAAMAQWKHNEFDGTADQIALLNKCASDIAVLHLAEPLLARPPGLTPYLVSTFDSSHPLSSTQRHSSHPLGDMDSSSPPTAGVISAFRAAASVYLTSVASGCNPDHPDVSAAVNRAVEILRRIPIADNDRSLVWPLSVVGTMARRSLMLSSYGEPLDALSDPDQRVYFTARFSLLTEKQLGCGRSAAELVKKVWRRRDHAPRGELVDWIDAMGSQPILLA